MITAVDTNVLVDVLRPDPAFGPASAAALRDAMQRGGLIACEVVGAHARGRADRLLTRDRGFLRSYFADLEIVDLSAA